jgi:hypothetical protein
MTTTRATILAALRVRLQPLAALVLRDEVLPERISICTEEQMQIKVEPLFVPGPPIKPSDPAVPSP